MHTLIKPGRIFFAVGMIALGILSFMMHDFIVGRPPAWPGNFKILNSFCATLTILWGVAIIFNIKGRQSAFLLGLLILIFSFLARHLPALIKVDNAEGVLLWSLNACKTLGLAGGAFIIAASFPEGKDSARISNGKLILTGCVFLGLFFILGGISHFYYAAFVKDFIPAYMPFHGFWTYFCGIALIAGGLGIIIEPTRYWAALLSGIMILGWFLLLHIPRFIAAPNDPSDRMGLCESFAFSGILFVLAGVSNSKFKIKK